MLTSNRFETARFTKPILGFIAALVAGSIVSPAFAQSSSRRDAAAGADRQIVRQNDGRIAGKSGRNAFAAVPGPSFQLDPNSPEATGGGSLGYNHNLLSY
jgi:hypothetical protein